jgi:hypothetical protein
MAHHLGYGPIRVTEEIEKALNRNLSTRELILYAPHNTQTGDDTGKLLRKLAKMCRRLVGYCRFHVTWQSR